MKLEPNNSPLINIYLFLLSLSLLYTTSPYLYTCCNLKQYQKKPHKTTPLPSHPLSPTHRDLRPLVTGTDWDRPRWLRSRVSPPPPRTRNRAPVRPPRLSIASTKWTRPLTVSLVPITIGNVVPPFTNTHANRCSLRRFGGSVSSSVTSCTTCSDLHLLPLPSSATGNLPTVERSFAHRTITHVQQLASYAQHQAQSTLSVLFSRWNSFSLPLCTNCYSSAGCFAVSVSSAKGKPHNQTHHFTVTIWHFRCWCL